MVAIFFRHFSIEPDDENMFVKTFSRNVKFKLFISENTSFLDI